MDTINAIAIWETKLRRFYPWQLLPHPTLTGKLLGDAQLGVGI